ncbi:uncharacterized protein LOC120353334 [Nilaparvata lugens]|uniref:uncharacterized protein LOC120353334 n=1 Tax=Nilaparvata lugens TaxID=108931 RepID=UPI00193E0494|nr:uncharacterized protein LOC120353334 [Nilaparvata lugens]
MHSDVDILFECSVCLRRFRKPHAASCHMPKCRGPVEDANEHLCELCGDRFATPVGLTQHRRHKHPAERITERSEDVRVARGTRYKVWSAEEDDVIIEYLRAHVGQSYTGGLVEILQGKTSKQIRDRVVILRKKGLVPTERYQDQPQEDENPAAAPHEEEEQVEDLRLLFEGSSWAADPRRVWLNTEQTHPLAIELQERWTEGPLSQGFLDYLVVRLTEEIIANRNDGEGYQWRGRRMHGNGNRASRKRKRYANAQELFKKCPSRLAELCKTNRLAGMLEVEEVKPPAGLIRAAYTDLWATEGLCNIDWASGENDKTIGPVTANEVRARLRRIKPGSAPGPAGIRRADIEVVEGIYGLLAGIFNALLSHGAYPDCWRGNSTTMIPKEGKDLSRASGWRPITVGNLLARLYSGCLEKRIKSLVMLSNVQRGFVPGNGCYINARMFGEILRRGKESSLAWGVLDL